jgi:hypothetical protein
MLYIRMVWDQVLSDNIGTGTCVECTDLVYEVKCATRKQTFHFIDHSWEDGKANGTGGSARHRLAYAYHAAVPTDQCRPQTTLLPPRQQTHHPQRSLKTRRRRLRARRRQKSSKCTSHRRSLLLRVRKRTHMRPPYRPPNLYLCPTQRICRMTTSHLRSQTSRSGRHSYMRAPPH